MSQQQPLELLISFNHYKPASTWNCLWNVILLPLLWEGRLVEPLEKDCFVKKFDVRRREKFLDSWYSHSLSKEQTLNKIFKCLFIFHLIVARSKRNRKKFGFVENRSRLCGGRGSFLQGTSLPLLNDAASRFMAQWDESFGSQLNNEAQFVFSARKVSRRRSESCGEVFALCDAHPRTVPVHATRPVNYEDNKLFIAPFS